MLRIAWRGLVAHKVRLVATVLAVVLGVAFMAGTQVFTDTFSKSFDEVFTDVNRGTDAVVRSNQKIEREFGDAQRSRIQELVAERDALEQRLERTRESTRALAGRRVARELDELWLLRRKPISGDADHPEVTRHED